MKTAIRVTGAVMILIGFIGVMVFGSAADSMEIPIFLKCFIGSVALMALGGLTQR